MKNSMLSTSIFRSTSARINKANQGLKYYSIGNSHGSRSNKSNGLSKIIFYSILQGASISIKIESNNSKQSMACKVYS